MRNFVLPRWTGSAVFALVAIMVLLIVFRLGTQASAGVALNDPVVWMEDGDRGRLLQINGSTQEITAEVEVGDDGDSLVVLPRGRDAVFLNRTTGVVGVVGAVSLSVDSEDSGPNDSGLTADNVQLLANHQSSTDWSNAYVVGDQATLVYSPDSGVQSEIPIPETSGALTATVVNADGELVAITGDSSQVVYSTELGLEQLVELPPLISENAARPGLVRAGESVYLVDSARRVLNELTVAAGTGEGIPICGSPGDVEIGGNTLTSSDGTHRILVHDTLAGRLSVVEPQDNECRVIELEDTGTNWGSPVAVGDVGYLPNYDTGEVVVVDLVDRVVTDTFQFRPATGRPFELEVFDGAVWANEPDGFRAAIISRQELVSISKLGQVFFGGEDSEGAGDGAFTRGGEDGDDSRFVDDDSPAFTIDDVDNGDPDDDGEDVEVGNGEVVESPDANEGIDVEPDAADQPDAADDTEVPEDDPVIDEPEIDEALAPEFIDPDLLQEVPVEPLDPVEPILVDEETQVVEPPADELVANFSFSSDTINVGDEVRLRDDSTGDPTSWNWDFDDGTSGSGPEVAKVWDSEGVFTVTLFVANAEGDLSQQTHTFTVVAENVLRAPSAGFTLSGDTVEVGETVTFTNTSTGEPEALVWEFGDDSDASGEVVSHSYDSPGVYTVRLTASNATGSDSVTTQVTVVSGVEPPVAVIGQFTGVVEVGQFISLTSTSTNTPTSTSWTFGDGESASGETVRHAWDTPGTYEIELSVENSAGSDTAVGVIVVEAPIDPPTARFNQSSLTVVQGEEIDFTNLSVNADSVLWKFGDGTTSTLSDVSHSWSVPGTYTVELTATNAAGNDVLAKTITVEAPPPAPTAAFTASATSTQVNARILFTDTSANSPNEWLWDFGDGNTSSAQNPPHSYSAPGEYTVTLTVSNDSGRDSTTTRVVVIDPPVASFTFSDTDLDVSFTDTSTNGPTSWAWDFGDGNTASARNPSHTYAAPGLYLVTLVATNDAGDSIPFDTQVRVDKAPTADFTSSTAGLTAQFTDTSTDGPASYSWQFGDGNGSSLASPSHTYASSGTYDVTLTVTNTAGSNSITKQVTVALAPPVANIACTVIGSGVSCDGTGSTSAVSYEWNAPGAIAPNVTGPNATFTYTATDNVVITLTVENSEGTTDSASETVSVVVAQPPTISSLRSISNANGVVELEATATENPTSWTWTTDGGTISNANSATPTITYTTPGSKTVTAVASNAVGDSAVESTTFTISIAAPPPVINSVTAAPAGVGVYNLSAVVSNTTGTYSWTTDGGALSSSTAATPTLTVTANGTYTVTLTVENADGATVSDSVTINVTDIPLPPPVVSPVTVGAESPAGTVSVSTTATNSPDTWSWSVPGAASSSGTGGPNPTFTFTSNGTYPGTVTASNGTTSNQVNFTIEITGFAPPPPPPPVAAFTSTVSGTTADFTFTGNDTDPGNTTYSWTFTGGAPGTSGAVNPAGVDFLAPGTYNVELTVTNTGGSNTATGSVIIP